ncbi:MAG: mercury transporter MerT [Deltaproteobacteria bacterium]|nr:MAG: mercury transporter MerT [Deltaproteobacteria bacterium]
MHPSSKTLSSPTVDRARSPDAPDASSAPGSASDRSRPRGEARRWSFLAVGGSVLTAFLASACCIGPLVLALLGLGGSGLLLKFEPYRPYFTALTVLLLGLGFYFAYRPVKRPAGQAAQGAQCDCPAPSSRRTGRILLWVATGLVAIFLAFPYLAPVLFG